MRTYEVYKITNKITNKIYIGITNQGSGARYRHHWYEARIGEPAPIHKSMAKYGGDGTFGRKHSEETKEKLRQKALGRKASDEAKKRMSETHKLNYSDEHRKAVAESNARRTKKVLMFDKDLNVIKEFNSLKEAAAETKIHSTTIRKSIRGNKISYDYVFRFKDAV